MSAVKKNREEKAEKKKGDLTTLRTNVTADEHEAVRWFAKVKLGLTLDTFVRQSVDQSLQRLAGKTLSVLAEESKSRGRLIQEELF